MNKFIVLLLLLVALAGCGKPADEYKQGFHHSKELIDACYPVLVSMVDSKPNDIIVLFDFAWSRRTETGWVAQFTRKDPALGVNDNALCFTDMQFKVVDIK